MKHAPAGWDRQAGHMVATLIHSRRSNGGALAGGLRFRVAPDRPSAVPLCHCPVLGWGWAAKGLTCRCCFDHSDRFTGTAQPPPLVPPCRWKRGIRGPADGSFEWP